MAAFHSSKPPNCSVQLLLWIWYVVIFLVQSPTHQVHPHTHTYLRTLALSHFGCPISVVQLLLVPGWLGALTTKSPSADECTVHSIESVRGIYKYIGQNGQNGQYMGRNGNKEQCSVASQRPGSEAAGTLPQKLFTNQSIQ